MKRSSAALCAGMLMLATVTAGCEKKSPEQATGPAGLKPSPAHGTAPASGPNAGGPLRFEAPEGWIAENPTSSMRKAQYRLPRAEGDPEDAELAVFYFQGGGGGVQDNIDRWIGQFTKPDGSPALDAAQVRKKVVNSTPVTLVEVSGTYEAAMMMAETKPKPNFRMLGAVVESAKGPWFFKLTGPSRTVAKWEPTFEPFVIRGLTTINHSIQTR